jgi:hypothetical protein
MHQPTQLIANYESQNKPLSGDCKFHRYLFLNRKHISSSENTHPNIHHFTKALLDRYSIIHLH